VQISAPRHTVKYLSIQKQRRANLLTPPQRPQPSSLDKLLAVARGTNEHCEGQSKRVERCFLFLKLLYLILNQPLGFKGLSSCLLICVCLQIWQVKRLIMCHHFDAWASTAIKQLNSRDSVLSDTSAPESAGNVSTISAAPLASTHLQPSRACSDPLYLKYFNAWFKFANVSQWARDLQMEHEYTQMKSVFSGWKAACRSRKPHPPLSPNSAAAAGVKSLMPGSAQRAKRSLASARPSDVAVSLDFFDSYSPESPIAEPQRPGLRRLVSPDDSARLMFFFGWFYPVPASFMCSHFFHVPSGMFFPPLLLALIWNLRDEVEMGIWRRYAT
jgi:hypothetical protein